MRRSKLPFSLMGRAFFWPIIVFAALIFAQALKMPLSYMTFVFVLLLPIFSVIQLVLGRIFIRAAVRTSAEVVEKYSPVRFSALISNECIFPFPFVEVELSVPDSRKAKCVTLSTGLSLSPYNGCEIRRSAEFAFRGVYEVGIRNIRVYDCFRTMSLRIDCERLAEIFVLPRRLELSEKDLAAESEQTTRTVIRRKGSDNTEASDIRTYLVGDSQKSIHWKLSSKSEELLVRDYSRNTGNSVYILCDLEPHYRTGEPQVRRPLSEYVDVIDNVCSDLVVENALAAAKRELRAMNTVTLMWLSEKDGKLIPQLCEINDPSNFETAYKRFAAAPPVMRPDQISLLASLISEVSESSIIISTACLDATAVSEYTRVAIAHQNLGVKAIELLYSSAADFFVPDEAAETLEYERIAALVGRMTVTQLYAAVTTK